MNKDDSCKQCKQRFKGVENFLRRIAFNLGNTPSQTEVKIISCIPIDVTDLQQKIIDLEKQLEKGDVKTVVNTVLTASEAPVEVTPKFSSASTSASLQEHPPNEDVQRKSSFVYPNATNTVSQAQDCRLCCTDISDMTNTDKRKVNFFCKRKGPRKKKTQLVYYTQTDNKTPFNRYVADKTPKNRGKDESYILNQSYLAGVVEKQYRQCPVPLKGMPASEISTPICRDVYPGPGSSTQQRQPSEMCSCCHIPFQNIDDQMSRQNGLDIFTSQTTSKNTYYDSNLYDIVPVKENPIKVKTNDKVSKTKTPKFYSDVVYWPENKRQRYKVPPMIVNYQHKALRRQHLIGRDQEKPRQNRKGLIVLNKMAKITPKLNNSATPSIKIGARKMCSIEFGEVYAKKVWKHKKRLSKALKYKDAACVTGVVANMECQTITVSNDDPLEDNNPPAVTPNSPDDETDNTLNQIKNMLQSFLKEVKTNGQLRNNSQLTKRDAVVQNGPSQSNIHGESQLLQSFTYSPYSMHPYGASCSRQMPFNNLCYPTMPPRPVKCMQHYPLFVQTSRMCSSFFKNNNQTNKSPNMKRAASVATNTERHHGRSNETENLIREIYKSVALNIEATNGTKENDVIRNHIARTEAERESKHVAVVISEIFKNTKPIDTSVTQDTNTPISIPTSNGFETQPVSNYARATRKESRRYYDDTTDTNMVINDEKGHESDKLESDEDSDASIMNEVTASSLSETETNDVVIAVDESEPQPEIKKGLFRKMLKIFKPRKRHRKVKEQPLESDSDDYQTVYSQKVAASKRQRTIKRTAYSKELYTKQGQQRPRIQSPDTRRSPYMEQEYRRYFDEKLTFHDQDPRSSAVRDMAHRTKPVYYKNIDTHTAFAKPRPRMEGVKINFPRVDARQKANIQNQ